MKLFLDDNRLPSEVVGDIYDEGGWQIVGDYNEFIAFIMEEGVPDVISFDHDLADEHYDIDWYDVYEGGLLPPSSNPTGLDCAVWLFKFCQDTNTPLPSKILVHSMNPIGKMEIEKHIATWTT